MQLFDYYIEANIEEGQGEGRIKDGEKPKRRAYFALVLTALGLEFGIRVGGMAERQGHM